MATVTETAPEMILPSVQAHAVKTVTAMFDLMRATGDEDYIGEPVTQLAHSLQAATLAQHASADDDTVLAALLHDVGRFVPASEDGMHELLDDNGVGVGRAAHEVTGERYLRRLGFGEKICQLVGAHVVAKRYLTATDAAYYDGLSAASKATLKHQGGPFDEQQVREADKDPWLQNKLAVRRWDDQAKEPDMQTPDLAAFEPMAVAALLRARSVVKLHGRSYALPRQPTVVVVVCVDGFDPEYVDRGRADGLLPHLDAFCARGFHAPADAAMPSFTNPNNVSIITGRPPAVHGVAGNFYLDAATGEERMADDPACVRGGSLLAAMAAVGVRVAAVTAKDKLRRLLSRGLGDVEAGAVCFSAERADRCTLAENGVDAVEKWIGRPAPLQYSGDLSLFALDAGVKLLEERRADLLYLTLSDYIQHKHAPGTPAANEFLAAIDARVGAMAALGAVVAVTGDHGMSDKSCADGSPNVLFLEDLLVGKFGAGCARVICPITDPYVKHHGALGSFVRVHLKDPALAADVAEYCRGLDKVETAMLGPVAAKELEMTVDTEGDVVVISQKNAVIGGREADHDLSQLDGHRLRSHGGLSEQAVPLILSRPVQKPVGPARRWRNFDVFDLALNY